MQVNAGGFIEVDDRLRTNVEGVYALGDINGNWQFRHAVNFEAEYLMETVVHGAHSDPIDYTVRLLFLFPLSLSMESLYVLCFFFLSWFLLSASSFWWRRHSPCLCFLFFVCVCVRATL